MNKRSTASASPYSKGRRQAAVSGHKTLIAAVMGVVVVLIAGVLEWQIIVHGVERIVARASRVGDQAVESVREQQALERQRLATREAEAQLAAVKLREASAARARRQAEFEAAFLKHYQAPKGCDNWQSDAHMVSCVNDRMRAKKAFQEQHFPDMQSL